MEAKVNWTTSTKFDATTAPPFRVLLFAICASSGQAMTAILEKMQLSPESLRIEAQGQLSTTLPCFLSSIQLQYHLSGDLGQEKAVQAVALSLTKYAGVAYMISKVCSLHYEVYLNQNLVHNDEVRFSLEVL
jgi:putative redox protein